MKITVNRNFQHVVLNDKDEPVKTKLFVYANAKDQKEKVKAVYEIADKYAKKYILAKWAEEAKEVKKEVKK